MQDAIDESSRADAAAGRPTSMRVLVIEDDRETAQFLQKSLKESGHAADLAGDGETGLSLAETGVYDVLIVDRMLPKLDGLSVVKTLRTGGVRTPVLILSALGDVDDRVKGLRAGGDDYLTKPYAYTELLGPHRGPVAASGAGRASDKVRGGRSRSRPALASCVAGR